MSKLKNSHTAPRTAYVNPASSDNLFQLFSTR